MKGLKCRICQFSNEEEVVAPFKAPPSTMILRALMLLFFVCFSKHVFRFVRPSALVVNVFVSLDIVNFEVDDIAEERNAACRSVCMDQRIDRLEQSTQKEQNAKRRIKQSRETIKLLSKEDLSGFGDRMQEISIGLNPYTYKS